MVIGVRATGVMVDGVIMILGVTVTVVMVTEIMVGIADSTFSGQWCRVVNIRKEELNR
jgi:hypothetical protein